MYLARMRVKQLFLLHSPAEYDGLDSTLRGDVASLAAVRTNVGVKLDILKTFRVQCQSFKVHYKQGTL